MRFAELSQRIGSAFDLSARLRPLTHCAALGAVAAMLSLAPAANAAVVASPAANIAVPATVSGIYVNVITGAAGAAGATTGWDINPWSSTSLSFFNPSAPAGGVYVVTGGTTPVSLAVGSVIDGSSSFGSGAANFAASWMLNSTNYFGFRFLNEGNGEVHYGYGSMIVGASPTARSIGELFYESVPGVGITVTAVPEPSTWAMMALGGVALGALARRRRKQAA